MIDEKKLIEDVSMLSKLIITNVKNLVHYVPTKCDNADEIISQCKSIRKVALSFGVIISNQPKVGEWIPVAYHKTTDEDEIDKERYELCLNCQMPDDEQVIIVCLKNGVVKVDMCLIDDGYYLDSGNDFIDDVIAWMPLPGPYKNIK